MVIGFVVPDSFISILFLWTNLLYRRPRRRRPICFISVINPDIVSISFLVCVIYTFALVWWWFALMEILLPTRQTDIALLLVQPIVQVGRWTMAIVCPVLS